MFNSDNRQLTSVAFIRNYISYGLSVKLHFASLCECLILVLPSLKLNLLTHLMLFAIKNRQRTLSRTGVTYYFNPYAYADIGFRLPRSRSVQNAGLQSVGNVVETQQ